MPASIPAAEKTVFRQTASGYGATDLFGALATGARLTVSPQRLSA
jgi:hypothetical protein